MKSSPKAYFTDLTSVSPCRVQKLENKQKPDVSGKLLELMWIKKKMEFKKNPQTSCQPLGFFPFRHFAKRLMSHQQLLY